MKINHVAIWTANLELLKDFYCLWLNAQAGPIYLNPKKGFSSYFLRFNSGARLELMHSMHLKTDLRPRESIYAGYAHLSLEVGNVAEVNLFAQRLKQGGLPILDGPRWTGDGYYEFVTEDPEGNRIELMASCH
ncbi:Lactoylglutathione lyase [Mariniradius saccharolyticus AK6]|uniref:Lactoylglutathione lyase n=1 Tax=Mariniradius saccharolyticus AK6 TaxID=1239962 RepID=M7X988_9BACT|nr:VOC family protein [Mariniradius saccharolyticus]EMS33965.1 Lactoylglutathione lyase [Mariniradius saccharolyticus AK6]